MIARLVVMCVWLTVASVVARAQTCSADSQCPGAGMTTTTCSGNAIVTSRSVCAGRCQTVEVARVPCNGACSGGTCIDLGAQRTGQPLVKPLTPCGMDCACSKGRLKTATGLRDVDGTCTVRIRRCPGGCSCDPKPTCRP